MFQSEWVTPPVRGSSRRASSQWSEVIPIERSGWFVEMATAVLRLGKLEPNWDGSGSPPVSRVAIHQALRMLQAVALQEPPLPQVLPVPGGGVQLEWHVGGRELELEFLPDGLLVYLVVEPGTSPEEGQSQLPREDLVRNLVQRLARSTGP